MSSPTTPTSEQGCTRDASGQLKNASEIDWVHSPSFENVVLPPMTAEGVATRTRGRIAGNKPKPAAVQPKKKPSKASKPRKNNNKKRKSSGSSDVEGSADDEKEEEEAEEEDNGEDDPRVVHEHLEMLAAQDVPVVSSKSALSADIRLIFVKKEAQKDGKSVKGHECSICVKTPDQKSWFAGNNSTLRSHISRYADTHYPEYLRLCEERGIEPHPRCRPVKLDTENGGKQLDISQFITTKPVYSPQLLLEHLIKLVVSDDQAFRLMDNKAFRDLIQFLRPSTREADIPHRTKLREKVIDKSLVIIQELKDMLLSSPGLISFTFDTWTSRSYLPFMAVTAHFIVAPPQDPRAWALKSLVIGFAHVTGNHGGQNMARLLTTVLDRYGLRSKLGWFTSDNATANDKTMLCLTEPGMAAEDVIEYDAKERRIRCGGHIINLAAKAFIEGVAPTPVQALNQRLAGTKRRAESEEPSDSEDDTATGGGTSSVNETAPTTRDGSDDPNDTEELFDTNDLLGKLLALINQIRASPQARAFFFECCEKKGLKPLQLLKWVRTRWSSMFDLLTRAIMLQPAVDLFVAYADRSNKVPSLSRNRTYMMFRLSAKEWSRLNLIHAVLKEPAGAQIAFSSETAPTVWKTLPILEYLQTRWETMKKLPEFEAVVPGLEHGLNALRKYYRLTDEMSVNIVCLVLTPGSKFKYIERKWDAKWIENAKAILENIFDTYAQSTTRSIGSPEHTTGNMLSPQPSEQLGNRAYGYASSWMLESVQDAVSGKDGDPRAELKNYLQSPLEHAEDVVGWWGLHQTQYPILAQMARDYLAVQGSAVPSERCFSSGGLTGTDQRARLNPTMFEALQLLKNGFRTGLIDVPSDLVIAGEDDMELALIEDKAGHDSESFGESRVRVRVFWAKTDTGICERFDLQVFTCES